ncbi:MAG: hypothetical protein H6Q55_1070 [Deltaproteobacteria bacterium]|jgi:hypothetical protein|nr:hypothetical protein [Deltaproteobacteria bacterium]
MAVLKDEGAAALLDQRHILDADVEAVISNAESTGEKLYDPGSGRFLAKLTTENATFYVEYSASGDDFVVHTAYFHRSQFMDG